MGLDIYAYAVPAGKKQREQIHYWRKHHALLDWCEKLARERGEESWDVACAGSIELTSADLDRLLAAVVNVELPEYAVYQYEIADYWTDHDLAFIGKARAALAAGKTVEIVASW